MKKDKTLAEHVFIFNEEDNGGESVSLITKFIGNGDPVTRKDGVYLNQELTLNSYCNHATFHLSGCSLTPENLRHLANELEEMRNNLVS